MADDGGEETENSVCLRAVSPSLGSVGPQCSRKPRRGIAGKRRKRLEQRSCGRKVGAGAQRRQREAQPRATWESGKVALPRYEGGEVGSVQFSVSRI